MARDYAPVRVIGSEDRFCVIAARARFIFPAMLGLS